MHGTRDVYGTNRARFREQCRRPAPEITRIEGGKQERRLYRPWSDAREPRSTNKERQERKRDEEKGHAEESASYENESERTLTGILYCAYANMYSASSRFTEQTFNWKVEAGAGPGPRTVPCTSEERGRGRTRRRTRRAGTRRRNK